METRSDRLLPSLLNGGFRSKFFPEKGTTFISAAGWK